MAKPAPVPAGPSASALRFKEILEDHRITHLVTVPDNTSAPILAAFEAEGARRGETPREGPRVRVLYATREGEGIGMASGLWLGGASPAVLIQNTGLLEAGDALRGTASRMGVPLLLLVTCRGYEKARGLGLEPAGLAVDREVLVRNDLDSVAHMTESTLKAWAIPYLRVSDPDDLSPVGEALSSARKDERPVAVLLDTSFH
ncbi:MAG: thiamine pyrophosphate-binding protein [Gemmatimonadota bacterium]|jgi:sulfopyruvate decarboxylase TPP-binding subunit